MALRHSEIKLIGNCESSQCRMKASLQNVREFGSTAGDCLLLLHDGSDLFLDLRNEDLRHDDACDLWIKQKNCVRTAACMERGS